MDAVAHFIHIDNNVTDFRDDTVNLTKSIATTKKIGWSLWFLLKMIKLASVLLALTSLSGQIFPFCFFRGYFIR